MVERAKRSLQERGMWLRKRLIYIFGGFELREQVDGTNKVAIVAAPKIWRVCLFSFFSPQSLRQTFDWISCNLVAGPNSIIMNCVSPEGVIILGPSSHRYAPGSSSIPGSEKIILQTQLFFVIWFQRFQQRLRRPSKGLRRSSVFNFSIHGKVIFISNFSRSRSAFYQSLGRIINYVSRTKSRPSRRDRAPTLTNTITKSVSFDRERNTKSQASTKFQQSFTWDSENSGINKTTSVIAFITPMRTLESAFD